MHQVPPVMVAVPPLPVSFQLSYEELESYPHNLIYRTACTAVLDGYLAKLNEVSSTHFIEEDEVADVPFRDFGKQGKFPHYSLPDFSANVISRFRKKVYL